MRRDQCGAMLTDAHMGGMSEMGAFYDHCLESLYPPGSCGTFCNGHTFDCLLAEVHESCCDVAGTNCPPGTTIPHTCPVGCAIVFPQFAETCRAHIAATSSLDSAQFAAFETTCLQQDALALVEYALDMRAQGCIIDLTGGSRRRRTQGTQYLAQWLTSDAHGCDWDEVDDYAADVDAICCGASGSLCPGGVPPNTCSPGCAVAFHQFTTSCAPTLDVIMPVGDARRAQINAFEAACLGSADTSSFLHAIMNASCPAGTGVATTPEPEPEPEPLPCLLYTSPSPRD